MLAYQNIDSLVLMHQQSQNHILVPDGIDNLFSPLMAALNKMTVTYPDR